jgi:hypothetical protein
VGPSAAPKPTAAGFPLGALHLLRLYAQERRIEHVVRCLNVSPSQFIYRHLAPDWCDQRDLNGRPRQLLSLRPCERHGSGAPELTVRVALGLTRSNAHVRFGHDANP